ncbi:hypothetical protein [Methylibium rhizosphaerae]|uniref:hypothetical protein n=1 Tax=Methylibium rhizosphaerae TaxID=2570323 RepID=UPI00112BA8F7|nr:hypothetical protein [Methylibium rhizosphaerae]
MRTVTLLLAALLNPALASESEVDVSLAALSPAHPPVVGRNVVSSPAGVVVAVVFPTEFNAQLVVLKAGKVEHQSPQFEFVRVANYGAAWVDQITVRSRSRFTLKVRTQQTCGAAIYDYNFVQKGDVWYVAGLNRGESQCSDHGIVPSWEKSYNFLNGRTISTAFKDGRPRKAVVESKRFPHFLLADFEALNPRYEP